MKYFFGNTEKNNGMFRLRVSLLLFFVSTAALAQTVHGAAESCLANTGVPTDPPLNSMVTLKETVQELREKPPTIQLFEKKGFDCHSTNKNPDLPWECVGHLAPYPPNRKVAFYIPTNYVPNEKPDFIVHLHGNYVAGQTQNFSNMLASYPIGAELAASNRNAIIMVPETENKYKTYLAHLYGKQQFDALTDSAMNLLNEVDLIQPKSSKPEVGQVTVTGHSAAYVTLGKLLGSCCDANLAACDYGKIKSVGIFDATYFSPGSIYSKWFARYAQESGSKLVNYHVRTSVRDTLPGSKDLLARLKSAGKPYQYSDLPKDSTHTGIMHGNYAEFISGAASQTP